MAKKRSLCQGDHVVVVDTAGTRISGNVEETVPDLNAAWVREDSLGTRHLIITDDLIDTPAAARE